MTRGYNRRDFARLGGIAAKASLELCAAARPARRINIGHTGISWGNDSLQAVKHISSLGYYGFETLGSVLEKWEVDPALSEQVAACRRQLMSAYCSFSLIDPARKKDEIDRMMRWAG